MATARSEAGRFARVGLAGLALGACRSDVADGDGPMPLYDPGSDAFFDAPFPDDARRDDDGTIALDGFPNPRAVGLLETYLTAAERLDGFATNAPIFVQLDGEIALPEPEETLDAESPVILVDIDPASPFRGERFPVQWEQTATTESLYAPEHLLAVAPLPGFPLRPATTYALILTTGAAKRSPDWQAGWEGRPALADAVQALGLEPEEVAIATTFTTQDPLEEMRRMSWFLREAVGQIPDRLPIERLADHETYVAWRTHYIGPAFTFGDPPYVAEGGEFRFDDEGRPLVARMDDLRLAVCVPRDPVTGTTPPEPPGGWPVVVFQDGTGGWYRGFCDSDSALELARRYGEIGFVGLGIDQPLHGTRPGADTATDLQHFNIVNPDAAVTNFRQGALDAIYLIHSLAARPQVFVAPDGGEVRLDPGRVYFMGHSQGGLTGALATPFFGGDAKGTMLSGAGGVLAITVIERKDPLDFASLVNSVVFLAEDEVLSPLHPILGLVQAMVEVTDPVNYAPYWASERPDFDWAAPTPVLLTSGTEDTATPFTTALALATAGRLPWVGDTAKAGANLELRTGPQTDLPVDGALATGWSGRAVPSAFAQFKGGSHWVIYETWAASDLAIHWLDSLAHEDGAGRLWNAADSTDPNRRAR